MSFLSAASKTYRGPFAVGLGVAVVLGLQATVLHRAPGFRHVELFDYGVVDGWLLGFLVGAGAMLAELPNSFMKRQLGVAPGQAARGVLGAVLWVVDQVDVLLGAWLVLALVVEVRLVLVLLSLGIVAAVHQLLTTATYALGMRTSPR